MSSSFAKPESRLATVAMAALAFTVAFAIVAGAGSERAHAAELRAGNAPGVKTQTTYSTQAVAKGSKYALLAKDGYLYPCNSKGKKLAKAWDAYSSNEPYRVTKLFVAANAKKVPDKAKYREYYKYSKKTYKSSYHLSSLSRVKNVTFLLKKGKSSCKSIAAYAFSYRTSLKTLTNFNKTKVATIGEGAFDNSGLRKVALPAALKTLGRSAFNGCKSLTTVSGLDKTKIASVGDYAFYQSAIKGIALPSTVKSIGADAFYGCRSLASVVLPASVKELGFGAFSGCSGLNSFTMKSATMVASSDSASKSMEHMLSDTPIANVGTAACIFVPKSLLAAYQSTAYTNPWRAYAAKFRAIA